MGWQVLMYVLWAFQALIFIRVILSWIVGPYPTNAFAGLIYQVTDPVLEPIRRILPDMGPIDLSPMVAILLLQVLQRVLMNAAYPY